MCIRIAAHQTECETRRLVLVNYDKDLILYHPFEEPPECSHASTREGDYCTSHGSCCTLSFFDFCTDYDGSQDCQQRQWHHLVVSEQEADELERIAGVEPHMEQRPIPRFLEDERRERIRRDLFNAGAVLWSLTSDARAMERALFSRNTRNKALWRERHSKALEKLRVGLETMHRMDFTWRLESRHDQMEDCPADGLGDHPWWFAFQMYVGPDNGAIARGAADLAAEQLVRAEAPERRPVWARTIEKEMAGYHKRQVEMETELRRCMEQLQNMERRQYMEQRRCQDGEQHQPEEDIYDENYGYVYRSPYAGRSRQEQCRHGNEGETPAAVPLLFQPIHRDGPGSEAHGLQQTPPSLPRAYYGGWWDNGNLERAIVRHQNLVDENWCEGDECPDEPPLADLHVRAAIPGGSWGGEKRKKVEIVVSDDEDEEPEEAGPSRRGGKHRRTK